MRVKKERKKTDKQTKKKKNIYNKIKSNFLKKCAKFIPLIHIDEYIDGDQLCALNEDHNEKMNIESAL